MVEPSFFEISYAINAHMSRADGSLKTVDRERAARQWAALGGIYESLGYKPRILPGAPGLPDMVFAANQVLAEPGGRLIPSRMRHREREGEVARVVDALRGEFEILDPPPPGAPLEGHGDILWHPVRRLLLAGSGARTAPAALEYVAAALGAPLLGFRLADPRWYHLDTCLAPLDERRALIVRDAFDGEGLDLLRSVFPVLLEAPLEEAATALACNAHCPDGLHAILEASATATGKLLGAAGFRVVPAETGEFLKAGGSVFCMKLMLP